MRLLRGCALGDTILLLGAAVYLAKKHGVIRILTSPNYYKSACDLLVNHPEVEAFTFQNEDTLPNYGELKVFDIAGNSVLQSLDGSPIRWYAEMDVPYNERWNSSPVPDATRSIKASDISPIFVHDYANMNWRIPVDGYRPPVTTSIIDHVPALKGAREIHCIDSSVFHFIDSMDPLDAELFYYPRLKLPYPFTPMSQNWNIVL